MNYSHSTFPNSTNCKREGQKWHHAFAPHHRVTVGIKQTALWKVNAAKAPLYTKLH